MRGALISTAASRAEEIRAANPLALDKEVPALVLKIGQYVIHHGTLGILRSLGRCGVPVYAIVSSRFAPVVFSRYLAGSFIWDTTDLSHGALFNGIAEIGQRLGRRAILIATDDASASFIAERSGGLAKWFLFPKVPAELPRCLANKRDLHFLCRKFGIPCPDLFVPTCFEDVQAFLDRATFPVVVKAADARRLAPGCRSTSIAHHARELLAIYRQAECRGNSNLVFQEYIPQSCSEDWIFHGYFNSQSGRLVAFTGKKLRSYPPLAGITTLGISVANETLRGQTERLLRSVGYSGVMDLDYRLDKRDGEYKLLDFNPRIGANFRMFEDRAGIDVVRALHLDLTGRDIRPSPMVEGRKFVVEPYDALAVLHHLRRSELRIAGYCRSLKGTRETACFNWRDPLPFLAMCVGWVKRAWFSFYRRVSAVNKGADGLPERNTPSTNPRP